MTTNDNPAPNDDDEWVSVNGHLDYHLGFTDSGIADDIEQRFGVFPRFGRAGGCVNMVLRLETGHVVNITDMDAPFLTALHARADSDGFTLDALSGGRVVLGVGVGWLGEEFEALGVPFNDRGRRHDDYLQAMKALWTQEKAAISNSFVDFRMPSAALGPRRRSRS